MFRHRHAILTAAVLAAIAGPAAALPPPIEELEPRQEVETNADGEPVAPARENPWSRGVPEDRRRAADTLFHEGNRLMRESITITAAAKYREALTQWDHPNIHYNLSIALVTLDQPVETYEHLTLATKYGAKPLEQERFEHAKNYIKLLEKQLARVRIRCFVNEAIVEVDGRQVFTGPGEYEGLFRAGRHTVIARREGYVTNQSARVLDGGQTFVIDLELKTLAELTETRRRWPAWRPWALVATGAVLTGAGGYLHMTGNDSIRKYDRRATDGCTPSNVCPTEPDDLARLRKKGRTMQTAGVAGYAVGGATLAAGIWLVLVNQGRTWVRPYDAGPGTPVEPAPQPQVQLSPFVAPGAHGLSLRASF